MDPFSGLPLTYYQMAIMMNQAPQPVQVQAPTQPTTQVACPPHHSTHHNHSHYPTHHNHSHNHSHGHHNHNKPLQSCCDHVQQHVQAYTAPNDDKSACTSSCDTDQVHANANTCSQTTSEDGGCIVDCSQTTSEDIIRDDCSQTSSVSQLSSTDDDDAQSYASSWSSHGDVVPYGAQTQVLEMLANQGSVLFDSLYHDTIIDGAHCDKDLPQRVLQSLCDFNKMIHSRFDFHGTLQKMLQSTITMYQASENQRLIEKQNYENVGMSTISRLEQLEDENRRIKAEGIVDTEDLTLYETKATLSLGKVGMRLMIYKTGDICAVTPVWVHNVALPIPKAYIRSAQKRGIPVDMNGNIG